MIPQHKDFSRNDRARPVLTPPGEEIPRRTASPFVVVAILSGLVLLVLLSALVIWLLPDMITRKTSPSTAQQTEQQTIPPDESDLQSLQKEAERMLGEWLKRQAVAETENLAAWGGKEYQDILLAANRGDQMFKHGDFREAEQQYRLATDRFDVLVSSKDERLHQALADGIEALGNNEIEEAVRAFEMALAIDPGDREAVDALAKTHRQEKALALYTTGLEFEQNNDPEQAQKFLQDAVRTDEEFTPAAEALSRVQQKLQENNYHEAMSRALAALDSGDLQTADQALTRAMELRPDEAAVKAAAERLRQKKTAARLHRLQQQADSLAADEKWKDVLEIYQQALKIDPEAGFAITGQREAEKRYRLDRLLREILGQPERLQDKGPLNEARQLLSMAGTIANPGPVLQSQINSLKKLIDQAATPVEVTLRSDNATTVEIYHVGTYTPFLEKHLNLIPGKYTIVGKRPGFRDVRMTIEVKPDDAPPLFVFIRCEEPL
jgi:tetratricopeptide (TPR) repeat protein